MGNNTAGLQGTGFKYEDQVRMSAFLHTLIDKPFLGISDISRIKLGIRDEGIWTDDLFIEGKNNYYIQVKKSILNSKSEFYDYIINAYKDYISFDNKDNSFFYLVTSENHGDISLFNNYLKEISNLSHEDYLKKTKLKQNDIILNIIKTKLNNIDDESLFYFLIKCRVFELSLFESEKFNYVDYDYSIIENLTKFSTFSEFEVYYSNLFWIISSKKETNDYLDKNYIVEKSERIGLVYTIDNKEISEEIYSLKIFIEDSSIFLDLNEARKKLEQLSFKFKNITKFNKADVLLKYFITQVYEYSRKIKIDVDYLKQNNFFNSQNDAIFSVNDYFHVKNYSIYFKSYNDIDLYHELLEIKKDTIQKSINRKKNIVDVLSNVPEHVLSSYTMNFYTNDYHKMFLIDMFNLIIKIYENRSLFTHTGSLCDNYCANSNCRGYVKLVEIKNFVDSLSSADVAIICSFSNERFRNISNLLFYYKYSNNKIENIIGDSDIVFYDNLGHSVKLSNSVLNLLLNHMSFFYDWGNEPYCVGKYFIGFYNIYMNDIIENDRVREVFAFYKKDTNKPEDLYLNPYCFFYDVLNSILVDYSVVSSPAYELLIKQYIYYIKKVFRFCSIYENLKS